MKRRILLLLLVLLLAGCKKAAKPAAPANTQAVVVPGCTNLPPVCTGGLLWQGASTDAINAYVAKYNPQGCRYTQPPRCPKNYKRKCLQECTP